MIMFNIIKAFTVKTILNLLDIHVYILFFLRYEMLINK